MKSESIAHSILKHRAIEYLREKGFEAVVEYRVKIEKKLYIIDVAGFKAQKSIAIECGHTPYDKVEALNGIFTKVIRFTYSPGIHPKNKRLKDSRVAANKAISTIFGNGKVVVPLEVRNSLGIVDGDKLLWIVEDGHWVIERA